MSRYGGEYAPQRWDRTRFEAASRGPPVMERDSYEEVDYYSRTRERTPPPRPREEEIYVRREEDRYEPRPRRERYYEDERDPYEGAMVRRPREDREWEIDISRREVEEPRRRARGGRPTFVRRQSSLDTHDRRPMPRYGDQFHEEETVYMPTRRRNPPQHWDEYEEVRVKEPVYWPEEPYRGYREREIERVRRRRSPSPSSDGTEVEEKKEEIVEEKDEIVEKYREIEEIEETIVEEKVKEFPRKGKTKMPLRLVNKRVLIEIGYPFEEEGETIIILKALGKEQIDEVISKSKIMNKEDTGVIEEKKTTYVFERTSPSPEREGEIIERKTEIIREDDDIPRSVKEWDQISMSKKSHKSKVRSPSPSEASTRVSSHHSRRRSSHHGSRARSHSTGTSPRRAAVILEEREESATVRGGLNALVIHPERKRRSSKSISKEIKELQREQRRLQKERESVELRGETSGGEIVIARERDDVVEIKKDKKAPDPRIIRAMLATLT